MKRNRMPTRFHKFSMLFVLALLLGPTKVLAETPFRFPEGKHGKGELKYEKGVPVLRVEGSPEEIGEQIAVLALKPAKHILDYPKDLLKRLDIEGLLPILEIGGEGMLPHFPPDQHRELEAMVKAGVDRGPVVLGNTMFD